jgi:carboxymethylenebutenolidase
MEGRQVAESNPRQNVTFASNGGQAHGYLAKPASGSGPGVILIQEWWGLDDHMVEVADRLAGEGFVTLAPDLYGGKVAHDTGDAGRFMSELPAAEAAKDLAGSVDYLLSQPEVTSAKLGAVGFCMGGGFVLALAAQQGDRIGAAVPFYGVGQGVPDSYRSITAPIQGHYAEQDGFYPVDAARQQEDRIRAESQAPVEFFYYPAGHAFHNDKDKIGTYHQESADLAWQRAIDFLKANLA